MATSAEIGAFLRARGKRVLTFAGYSASGYQDPAAMLGAAAQVLAGHSPGCTWINIGATEAGIGAVYPLARQLGFATLGIVSSLAREQALALSPSVDRVFFVADSHWGGCLPGSTQLSPTSAALVEHSDELVAIGGNRVAADELMAACAAGKAVRFMAADMDHRLAVQRAARRGEPAPTDFRGAADAAWAARR
ncbi:MAG: hypothetical protein ABIR94_11590 [Rubrivivax sp.]